MQVAQHLARYGFKFVFHCFLIIID
jgi:hypothetical protein